METYQAQLTQINYLSARIGEVEGYLARNSKTRPELLSIEQDTGYQVIKKTISEKTTAFEIAKN